MSEKYDSLSHDLNHNLHLGGISLLNIPIQIHTFHGFRCDISSLLDLLPENHLYHIVK